MKEKEQLTGRGGRCPARSTKSILDTSVLFNGIGHWELMCFWWAGLRFDSRCSIWLDSPAM